MPITKDLKGIYLIERINTDENKEEPIYYIGQSVGIFDRWKQHSNDNEQYIDKAIQKFSCLNFSFTILEEVAKRDDLNECETKWINKYKEQYGEKLMYNVSQTTNNNPHKIDTDTKKEIKDLFEAEIGRSIYAISEKYNIGWKAICDIRKSLLKDKGLKYDNTVKNIVDEDGVKPTYWKGNRITKALSEKILLLKTQDKDDNDIATDCNISITDLKQFYIDYETDKDDYNFAERIN